jgi:type IV pilus assembly protein PilP
LYRTPEPLEKFPLDALNMVGTLDLDGQVWGLIKTPPPEQLIHRVQINHHIGQNRGKIFYIGENRIDVMETVDDGTGCFERKENSLKMLEQK